MVQIVNASASAYWNGISSRVKYPIVSSVLAATHLFHSPVPGLVVSLPAVVEIRVRIRPVRSRGDGQGHVRVGVQLDEDLLAVVRFQAVRVISLRPMIDFLPDIAMGQHRV